MREFKQELRANGQDVCAVIRDPSRRRDYYQTKEKPKQPAAFSKSKQKQKSKHTRISKDDLEALQKLDLV